MAPLNFCVDASEQRSTAYCLLRDAAGCPAPLDAALTGGITMKGRRTTISEGLRRDSSARLKTGGRRGRRFRTDAADRRGGAQGAPRLAARGTRKYHPDRCSNGLRLHARCLHSSATCNYRIYTFRTPSVSAHARGTALHSRVYTQHPAHAPLRHYLVEDATPRVSYIHTHLPHTAFIADHLAPYATHASHFSTWPCSPLVYGATLAASGDCCVRFLRAAAFCRFSSFCYLPHRFRFVAS